MLKFAFLSVFTLIISVASLGQTLYDTNKIQRIDLEFPEENWQYPLHYLKSIDSDKMHAGNLIINGDTLGEVGVKFKGQSSYDYNFKKNPLSIELDYVNKQKYQGVDELKLSNGNIDPSWIREVLAYEIARKYMIAPRSNYVVVYVNGSFHGVFGNTEAVDGKFAEKYFHIGKNNFRIKGNAPKGRFKGGPSSLKYMGENRDSYKESYELKGDTINGYQYLIELTKAIKNQNPEEVEAVLDVNDAIWMIAFNNALLNLDSYNEFQQNYYLIRDKNGVFHPVLWDLNLAFDGLGKDAGIEMQPEYPPLLHGKNEQYPLIQLIAQNDTYRKMYFAHYRTIIEENFYNDWYKKRAVHYQDLISKWVEKDTNWVFNYSDFQDNLTKTVYWKAKNNFPFPGIIELMEARKAYWKKHPELNRIPPSIRQVKATKDEDFRIRGNVSSDATDAIIWYRSKKKKTFTKQKMSIQNGVASITIPIGENENEIEYYIFIENERAGVFYPRRAKKEIMVFP